MAANETLSRIDLGPSGVEHVVSTIRSSAGAGHPLASLLSQFTPAFAEAYVFGSAADHIPTDFDVGGVGGYATVEEFALLVSGWLGSGRSGSNRALVFEETVAMRSGASVQPTDRYFGDRIYGIACRPGSKDEVESVFASISCYPAVGVLCEPESDLCISRELDELKLAAISDSAVALVVLAFDEEAFIVASLGDRPFEFGE